jgi:hypothetical protein
VEISDKIGGMSKFVSGEPRRFFISTFVAYPLDKVQEFAALAAV